MRHSTAYTTQSTLLKGKLNLNRYHGEYIFLGRNVNFCRSYACNCLKVICIYYSVKNWLRYFSFMHFFPKRCMSLKNQTCSKIPQVKDISLTIKVLMLPLEFVFSFSVNLFLICGLLMSYYSILIFAVCVSFTHGFEKNHLLQYIYTYIFCSTF